MKASLGLKSLLISDETNVSLPMQGVALIVGPNNAGKSQALRDIANIATSRDGLGVVVKHAEFEYSGTPDDLRETFESAGSMSALDGRVDLGAPRGRQDLANILAWWSNQNSRHLVANYFILLANTESRLQASLPVSALDLYHRQPTLPTQVLYEHPETESLLDSISREAFGSGLLLDVWAGGNQWGIRVGELETPRSPRPTREYLDALKRLPLLNEQGDGVRSMIGLLLTLFTGHHSVALVDEPEAFLHPPQARYLGRLLSDYCAKEDHAVVMATHSTEIVHGVLEGSAEATVIRITREGSVNRASILDNEAVRKLWTDPLLRYSKLLDGLFADAVVICESEADCKFFASVRDSLESKNNNMRHSDILFTSCGGKQRMKLGVEALRAARVPVAVIGDFDVLNDWTTLRELISAFDGNPSAYESSWKVLNGALQSGARTPSLAGVRDAVCAALDKVEEVSKKSLRPVHDALKIESGWDRVKNTGLNGVPSGDQYAAAEHLMNDLGKLGIHLVPVGEMEDLVPGIAGHGTSWVSGVLESGCQLQATAAQTLLQEVVESLL